MVHGKSSEADVGPAQERKTFLNRHGWDKILPHVRNELKMYFFGLTPLVWQGHDL